MSFDWNTGARGKETKRKARNAHRLFRIRVEKKNKLKMLMSRFSLSRIVGLRSNICLFQYPNNYQRHLSTSGAVEIDQKEHIFAHPNFIQQVQDHRSFGVRTAYDIINQSGKTYSDRILFSYRSTSNQTFQSLTYK